MPKRGLPASVKMRHDSHYVEELTKTNKSVGRTIPIDKLVPNPEQPRVEIGDLGELSQSIKEKGVLEPILVKPNHETGNWMIIAGERRWRASNLAGLKEVPCIELDLDDKSIAEIALIENLQRKDLTIWEVADGLAFLGERFDYTHEDIGKRIGKSRTTVTESLTIAGLPNSIREKCQKAEIKAKSVLLEIARQFDEKAMHEFLDKIIEKDLNRKEIRKKARPRKSLRKTSKELKPKSSQEDKTGQNIFSYSSIDESFYLEINFKKKENFDEVDILMALKQAFESIKAETGK